MIADRVERLQLGPERVEVPARRGGPRRCARRDLVDDVLEEVLHALVQVVALEDVAAVAVDRLALAVQHVVVLQHVLADLGVARLDLRLRRADGAGDDLRLDGDVVGHARATSALSAAPALNRRMRSSVQRQVEAALAGVALTAGTTAQLVVDAARLVALGAEHVEAAGVDDLGRPPPRPAPWPTAKTASHAASYSSGVLDRVEARGRASPATARNSALPPSMMSVPRPAMLVATVTAPMRPACATIAASRAWFFALRTSCWTPFLASRRERYSLFSTLVGADEHRLAVARGARRCPRRPASNFAGLVLVDEVGLVLADHRLVGRDRHDAELVGRHELGGLGLGGAGHARELVVEAEVVLQRDGGEGLVLGLDLHALLRLDRLVDALVVAAADQDAAGVLVDDEDLAVHDDVVLVALEQRLGLDRVVEERDQRGVGRLVEVVDAEVVLDLLDAGLEHADGALLLVDLVVDAGLRGGSAILANSPNQRLASPDDGAGDDQRRAGLVDEDRVDLVDDREVVAALHQVARCCHAMLSRR